MVLHFRSADTALRDLQVWHAESDGYLFAISHENRSGGVGGKPGYFASWRSNHSNKAAIALEGSPFATFEQAEEACQWKLAYLSANN
jgi:hypothetical protein